MINTEQKIALSRATKAPTSFKVPAPKGVEWRDYQLAGVYYTTLQNATLIADDQGVGKTIQAIMAMNYRGAKRPIIICPSALVSNWARELRKFSTTIKVIEVYHPKKFLGLGDAVIVPLGQLVRKKDTFKVREILEAGPYDTLIIDEPQKLKNPKAHKTKLVLAKNGLRSACPIAYLLTGTAFEKNPMEIFHLIQAFAPQVLPRGMDRFGYGIRYCGGHKLVFGEKEYWKFDGASNQGELGRRLRAGFMVRRTKDQVLHELPPKTVNVVELDPNARTRASILQIASMEEFKSRGAKNAAFEEYSEAWKALGMLKVPYALDYVTTLLEGGWRKILVFCHHVEVAERLAEGFNDIGMHAMLAHGKMSTTKRAELVEQFQNPKDHHRVFVLTQNAMAEGHTLTAASYGVAVEFSTKPGKNKQMEDRAHRIGQTDNFFFDYLVMKGSLDYKRLKMGRARNKDFEEVMA